MNFIKFVLKYCIYIEIILKRYKYGKIYWKIKKYLPELVKDASLKDVTYL